MILNQIIGLLGSFFESGIADVVIYPLLCLAFLATVPFIIRAFVRR